MIKHQTTQQFWYQPTEDGYCSCEREPCICDSYSDQINTFMAEWRAKNPNNILEIERIYKVGMNSIIVVFNKRMTVGDGPWKD